MRTTVRYTHSECVGPVAGAAGTQCLVLLGVGLWTQFTVGSPAFADTAATRGLGHRGHAHLSTAPSAPAPLLHLQVAAGLSLVYENTKYRFILNVEYSYDYEYCTELPWLSGPHSSESFKTKHNNEDGFFFTKNAV